MFAVIYRFKVKEGQNEKFEKSWADVTYEFREIHGGLGSCLHLADNGEYVAYARWPNRETWLKEKNIKNQKAVDLMKESILERYEPMPLEVENNLLI